MQLRSWTSTLRIVSGLVFTVLGWLVSGFVSIGIVIMIQMAIRAFAMPVPRSGEFFDTLRTLWAETFVGFTAFLMIGLVFSGLGYLLLKRRLVLVFPAANLLALILLVAISVILYR